MNYICSVFKEKSITSLITFGTPQKYPIDKNMIFPLKMKEFESFAVPIPNEYSKYLENIYGDYMTLPPIEERITHHQIIEVKFESDL